MSPRGLAIDDKRWAQRANALQYQELELVRRTAEQWRTGMAALTALLSVTSIIAAPGLADRVTGAWRTAIGLLVLAGLLALLFGTWQAMRAAFGHPDAATTMTGERLRTWESQQAQTAAQALARARTGALTGMTLLIATAGITFLAASSVSGPMARVDTGNAVYCGKLGKGDGAATITVSGRDGTIRTIPLASVRSLDPAATC
ncbi:hypothetical protein AB0J83_48025 [Actinoplanes sp. NPDC049596]|uniref:hypothetical protein n=1 Tax=unclassified Actinoplanes TaxID=2626549 RepID=UPI003449C9B6